MADFGLPPGPLAAYLGVRDENARQSMLNTQNAMGQVGILSHLNALANEKRLADAMASGDVTAIARVPGGIGILAKLAQIQSANAAAQNAVVTGQLHSAQIGEITDKAGIRASEQAGLKTLSDLLTRQSPEWSGPAQIVSNPQMETFKNSSNEQVTVPREVIETERINAERRAQGLPEIPLRMQVPNQSALQAAIVQAGKALPRGTAAALLPPVKTETPDRTLTPIIGPDGKPVLVPRAQAIGQTPVTASTTVNVTNPLGNDPNFWYEFYDKTKTLPPMAWGQAGNPTREAFLKGFPEWKKAQGGTASDTAASQAQFKGNASAFNSVTKDIATFEPYKKMLDTNVDIAIRLGDKIMQTNAALVNRPLNWIRQNASSNPDVAEYLAQMKFVQIEAARVINNPRIVGQLTDEARKEMSEIINGNAPIAVVNRVLQRLKSDGTNRFNAMRSQQSELVEKMKGITESVAADTTVPTPTPTIERGTSRSGKPMHKENGQWVYD